MGILSTPYQCLASQAYHLCTPRLPRIIVYHVCVLHKCLGKQPLLGMRHSTFLSVPIRATFRVSDSISVQAIQFFRVFSSYQPVYLFKKSPGIQNRKMISDSLDPAEHFTMKSNGFRKKVISPSINPIRTIWMYRERKNPSPEYVQAIKDLNSLQSNNQVIALAKYRDPEKIIPLFTRQLESAGISLQQLDELKIIHVSGTKGKGSTCAFIDSILNSAGLKTGFYNSPHLIKVTERIKINSRPIDDDKFSCYFRTVYNRLINAAERNVISMPSYFSFLTILAFHIFLEEKVDCAIIEVGIGGEYDPTNVIRKPVACGITTLDYDHTNILGKTIEQIAWTKAGIIKPDVPVYTIRHEQQGAIDVISKRAIEKGAPLYICEPFQKSSDLELGIQGLAQHCNAALACALSNHYLQSLDKPHSFRFTAQSSVLSFMESSLPRVFRDGLMKCSWPGRCQILDYQGVTFFIDGAHTKKSMDNCLDWFLHESEKLDANASKVLMVNVIGERNKSEVLRPLAKYNNFRKVIFSTNRINCLGETSKSETFVNLPAFNSEKSIENAKSNASIWETLVREEHGQTGEISIESNTSDSLKTIERLSLSNNCEKLHVLATGSLHFVGAVLETLSFEQIDHRN